MPFLGFITHLSMPLFSTGSSLREFQVNPTCADLPRVTSLHLIQSMGSQKLVVFILFQIPLTTFFYKNNLLYTKLKIYHDILVSLGKARKLHQFEV